MRTRFILWSCSLWVLLGFCVVAQAASNMASVCSWGYQLQNADPATLAASPYDLIVMDYSRDGTDGSAYTPAEIALIKSSGKKVLCYFSIGEAEDYRFYWQSTWKTNPPTWLGPENPDWGGNYKVRYWEDDWFNTVLLPYVQRIVAAGFDGVYLDIIDAYWYWSDDPDGPGELDLTTAANRMITLVGQISQTLKASIPSALIFPQNGEAIIDDADEAQTAIYLTTIDGLGMEDLFYHSTQEDRTYRLSLLPQYTSAGVGIFNIEYIDSTAYTTYRQTIEDQAVKIIPYASHPDRSLDSLSGFVPDGCQDTDALWVIGNQFCILIQ
ncbi:MJ1477/TM1410 family putative glycoside hydrolase [Desulfovibrio inopinatus]|uniref:MJ1477/TM1410 family putative glycoside hydrolase n=1 Tax=Desulfovibrio inopinatus TaxID=102109 RepID=UPI0003FC44F0|nr:MJ1477/TM1410 family putative glycoside hydrolase [Desulfovibrio inopinatus]